MATQSFIDGHYNCRHMKVFMVLVMGCVVIGFFLIGL